MNASVQPDSSTVRPVKFFLVEQVFKEPGARKTRGFNYNRYRPQVLARHRLRDWSSTFYERNFLSGPSTISLGLTLCTEDAVLSSLSEATLESYGAGLLRFHEFCDKHKISEDDRVPAGAALLEAFLADVAWQNISEKTASNWLAGIRTWHLKERAPWLVNVDSLRMVLTAIRKGKPASSKRPQRPPVTLQHLSALRDRLNFSDTFDVAVWAVATAAFWGCCRLGELVVQSRSRISPFYNVLKSTKVAFHSGSPGQMLDYVTFDIPWTKTTQSEGATITLTDFLESAEFSPISALRVHLRVNSSLPDDAPLFSYASDAAESGWAPMVKEWFMERCNEVWVGEGLGKLSGHSFRIGGATELLLMGYPPTVVQRVGRWESDAFLVYWRKLEQIVPTFAASYRSDSRFPSMLVNLEAARGAGSRS